MKNPFAVTSLLCALLVSGCAHSDISVVNSQGKPVRIAHFEGDMTVQHFAYTNGKTTVEWDAATVSHSAATEAQGDAAHSVLGGVATLTTSTGVAVATSGALPGGLGALVQKVIK